MTQMVTNFAGQRTSRPYIPAAVLRRQRRNRRIGYSLFGLASAFLVGAFYAAAAAPGSHAIAALACLIGFNAAYALAARAFKAF